MTNDQHTRPLWIGMLACALCPTLMLEVLFQFSAEKNMMLIPDLVVIIFALPVSLIVTFGVALPYTLWLKRRAKLNAIRLGVAGVLSGAVAFAAFSFYNAYWPQMNDYTFMLKMALKAALSATLPGAILGFLSAVALSIGAGITFRSSGTPPLRGSAP